jgi:hypothetical protein
MPTGIATTAAPSWSCRRQHNIIAIPAAGHLLEIGGVGAHQHANGYAETKPDFAALGN